MNFYSDSDIELTRKSFSSFRHFREQGRLCDVILEAKTDLKVVKRIFAHRVVLASRVPYFRTMFTTHMLESNQKSIFIKNVEADVLQAVVSYAYGEEFTLPEDRVILLLVAADLFLMSSLREKCCTFLKNHIHPGDCIEVGVLANAYNFQDLYDACTDYARSNFEAVTSLDEHLIISSDDFKHLISSDKLGVKREELVYAAVLKWVHYDIENRKSEFPTIFSHVRLPFVSLEFLSHTVEQEPLVQNDKKCMAYLQEAYTYKAYPEKRVLLEYSPRLKPRKVPGTDDMLVTIGGLFAHYTDSHIMEKYKPENNNWTIVGEIEKPRFGLNACYHDGYIYTVGGFLNDSMEYLNSLERYCINKDKWEHMMPMKESRMCHSVCTLYGLIFVTGGENSDGILSSLEKYSPDSNSWVSLAAMNSHRSSHGMAHLMGHLFVAGGRDEVSILNTVEFYSPSQDIWTSVSCMSIPRYGLAIGSIESMIYAVGGHDGNSAIDSVEIYDKNIDQWDLAKPLNISRSGLGLVKYDDTLYACGGTDDGILNSVEKYNSISASWKICESMQFSKSLFGIISTLS